MDTTGKGPVVRQTNKAYRNQVIQKGIFFRLYLERFVYHVKVKR